MYYDSIAKGYDGLHMEEQMKKLLVILDNLRLRKSDLLLDVGSGTSFSLNYFKCDSIGVDPSLKLLEYSTGEVVNAAAENLPFLDGVFDIVVSITAIHNFDNIEKGLFEMKRVGKNRFVFSVLRKSKHFDTIEELICKMFKVNKIVPEEKDVIFFCNKF